MKKSYSQRNTRKTSKYMLAGIVFASFAVFHFSLGGITLQSVRADEVAIDSGTSIVDPSINTGTPTGTPSGTTDPTQSATGLVAPSQSIAVPTQTQTQPQTQTQTGGSSTIDVTTNGGSQGPYTLPS